MIRFQCPQCRGVLEAPDYKGGEKINCPACGQRLQIPRPLSVPTRKKTVLGALLSPIPSPRPRPPSQPASANVHNSQAEPGDREFLWEVVQLFLFALAVSGIGGGITDFFRPLGPLSLVFAAGLAAAAGLCLLLFPIFRRQGLGLAAFCLLCVALGFGVWWVLAEITESGVRGFLASRLPTIGDWQKRAFPALDGGDSREEEVAQVAPPRANTPARSESPKDEAAILQNVREAAHRAVRRMQGKNNLHRMALAMFLYDGTYGTLPAVNSALPPGFLEKFGHKPQLSWRVAILPFIEQQHLYKQFMVHEPWDSPNNIKLLGQMPAIYRLPGDDKTPPDHTHYQVFVGKGAAFEKGWSMKNPKDFPDGTSNTILIVEASKAVPWTKPEDIEFDPMKSLPTLGLPGASYFLAAMCDCSVRMIARGITEKTLRNAVTRNGGEVLGPDW